MKTNESKYSTSNTKMIVAKEILFMQRTAGYSFLVATGVAIVCLLLFRPFKFDGDKYRKVTGITQVNSSNLNTPIYSPLSWSDGFFDYCDGKVGFNPYSPQASYYARKQFLLWKSFRMGLYAWIIAIIGVLLYRYGLKGKKLLIQNAQ